MERHWTYQIEKGDLKDGSGAVIATLGFDSSGQNGVGIDAGAFDPLSFNSALPNPLVITPEAQNGDYIQFTIGSQSWTTKDNGAVPGCNTGAWSSAYSPAVSIPCLFLILNMANQYSRIVTWIVSSIARDKSSVCRVQHQPKFACGFGDLEPVCVLGKS